MAKKVAAKAGFKTWGLFISLVLISGLFWQCGPTGKQVSRHTSHPADGTFTILQINDVYRIEGIENGTRGGFARLRTLRKQLEARDDVLLLHGGDLLYPSVMSRYSKAKTMVDALNNLDGAPNQTDPNLFVVFGNHEFDSKRDVFDARVTESDFTWLASNLFYMKEGASKAIPFADAFDSVLPMAIREIAGLKVGIFSVTLDDYKTDYVRFDYDYESNQAEIPAIRDTVAKLKQAGADVLIALTHQTFSMDQKLACDVPEIDLVIGGHEHVAINSDGCGTSITKADSDAVSAWVIEVDASGSGKPRLKKTKVLLDESLEKEPTMDAFVTEKVVALSKEVPDYFKTYGATEFKLEGLELDIRGRETALGNWLSDVARKRMGTEIAVLNGGGIRINDNIPAGSDIRGEHLAGIFYYATELVSFNLKGSELIDVLNNSVAFADRGSGRFLQVSGIRFAFEKAKPNPEGIRFSVVPNSVRINNSNNVWRALDPNRTYSVTTSKYLWSNGYGDGYKIFSKGNGGTSPALTSDPNQKVDLRQVIEHWLKLNKVVRTDIDGRIARSGSPTKGS